MAKPIPKRIPSDDCVVTIDGDQFNPHEGEWVEMFTAMTVGEIQGIEHLRQIGVQLNAIKGEENETEQISILMDRHYEEICEGISRRLKDWNWTDLLGNPLPKPNGTVAPLKLLNPEELYWLLMASQGDTPTERKNASRPSRTTSSAIG